MTEPLGLFNPADPWDAGERRAIGIAIAKRVGKLEKRLGGGLDLREQVGAVITGALVAAVTALRAVNSGQAFTAEHKRRLHEALDYAFQIAEGITTSDEPPTMQ